MYGGWIADYAIKGFIFLSIVALPLAIWKVIDIIVWVFQHVQLGIK